jgi:hypothetical protein
MLSMFARIETWSSSGGMTLRWARIISMIVCSMSLGMGRTVTRSGFPVQRTVHQHPLRVHPAGAGIGTTGLEPFAAQGGNRMLTLYHGPVSRSSRIIWLLEELGVTDYRIAITDIPRPDGTGAVDPSNPHPDKKVPALVDDDALVTESSAIVLYLTDKFPRRASAGRSGIRSAGRTSRGSRTTRASSSRC